MSLASSQRCREVHCGSWSNAQHCAIDEFRESWGEDMARDLELIPIDILLVTRIHENNGIMTLIIIGYHWQQIFWNMSGTSGRLHTFPSSFKHYAAHGFWTGQLHWEMLRPQVLVASVSNPNRYPLVVLVIGNPAFTVDFPIETLGFHGQATLLEDVHFRNSRSSEFGVITLLLNLWFTWFFSCEMLWNSSVGFSLVISVWSCPAPQRCILSPTLPEDAASAAVLGIRVVGNWRKCSLPCSLRVPGKVHFGPSIGCCIKYQKEMIIERNDRWKSIYCFEARPVFCWADLWGACL